MIKVKRMFEIYRLIFWRLGRKATSENPNHKSFKKTYDRKAPKRKQIYSSEDLTAALHEMSKGISYATSKKVPSDCKIRWDIIKLYVSYHKYIHV